MAENWNGVLIDKYPVEASYVDPVGPLPQLSEKDLIIDQEWYARHVRLSQYLLQIKKCDSRECCKSPRSNIFEILPDGLLPPPMRVKQTFERGLHPAQLNDKSSKFLPLLARLALKIEINAPGFSKVFIYEIYNNNNIRKTIYYYYINYNVTDTL